MRKILLLLPLLGFSACAAGPNLESRMAAYTGASEQTLVQQLGVPDKQITVNGVQYLAYERHRTEIDPGLIYGGFGPFGPGFYGGPFWGPGFGAPIYDAGIPASVRDWSCETTFMLKDDKVYNFTLRGNDCG
jgi:hypothetical protein